MTSRLNQLLKAQQPFVQTVGIMAALAALGFAGYQSYLTRLALEISERQFAQQQTPLWEFDVNDREQVITISTRTPDVRLEQAFVTYPTALREYEGQRIFGPSSFTAKWNAGPPPHRWDLSMIAYSLGLICAASPVRDELTSPQNILFWPERESPLRQGLPAALEVTYTYRGESKRAKILYLMPINALRRSGDTCMVSFGHPQLVRYLDPREDTQTALGEQLRSGQAREGEAD